MTPAETAVWRERHTLPRGAHDRHVTLKAIARENELDEGEVMRAAAKLAPLPEAVGGSRGATKTWFGGGADEPGPKTISLDDIDPENVGEVLAKAKPAKREERR